MGMPDDFEVAIDEGATIVRIGRAILGERMQTGPVPMVGFAVAHHRADCVIPADVLSAFSSILIRCGGP
jgi:hypothetical protein